LQPGQQTANAETAQGIAALEEMDGLRHEMKAAGTRRR